MDCEVENNYNNSFTKNQGATLLEAKCSRDIKPVLNSPLKNTKKSNSSPPEFPEEVFTWLVNMTKEILLDVSISPQDKQSFIPTHALLDIGTNVIFINKTWAEEKKLSLQLLCHAIPTFNTNSIKNSAGNITHYADIIISYQGHCEKVTAKVMDFGKNQMILGFIWLQKHNTEIDWEHSMIKMTCCPNPVTFSKNRPPSSGA